MNNRFRYFDS
jgi:putative transposase